MSHKPSVLIVGIGEVGRYILDFLARDNTKINIVAADLHLPDVEAKINNAILGAAFQSRYPDVKALEIDLFDLERTADILNELQPDVVINCAVLQTWHVIRRLPENVYSRLSSAGLGAWLPVQLTLAMKLAQAIKLSGISAHYINTSLSDLTNPVLDAMGIPPTIGIGNIALIESAVRTLVARILEIPGTKVVLKMVAHHVHWVTWREAGYREGAPFYMKIFASGQDVTDRFDTLDLMKKAILLYPSGTYFSAVSASSAIQNLGALLSKEAVSIHSPGPNGLPGGYPVILSREGARVDLPADISLDEAININKEAQTYDGIKEIDAGARVHFMPYTIDIMKEVLNFDCISFTPEECDELAKEQIYRFQELERRCGG
ncbi:saccharopine dehydrogenase NADP-binding domain-containing protein [candidate division KSB1 bacterium]|nr:saccharopine dehydrogenase NADP-binding domain-containing protein [candidate division KSB1 bacterium]